MEDFLLYLGKATILLSLFFLVYFWILRKQTSFWFIRMFFLSGIFVALVLPAVTITRTVESASLLTAFVPETPSQAIASLPAAENVDPFFWIGLLYLAGGLFVLSKFLLQLGWLLQFLIGSVHTRESGFYFIVSQQEVQPFSFFHFIAYNPELHTDEELSLILRHEKAHARQWHSLDVILLHLLSALFWFNPLTWLYKKAGLQNLEYLADRQAVSGTLMRQKYQKTLLKVAVANYQPALVNPFYQSLIKKRILMLNQTRTNRSSLWPVGFILPFLVGFFLSFQVKTLAQTPTRIEVKELGEQMFVVSPKSTDKDLKLLSEEAAEAGFSLDFKDVERRDGLITSIEASYRSASEENSGTYVLHDEKGIEGFIFFVNENGNAGFRSGSFDTGTATIHFASSHPSATRIHVADSTHSFHVDRVSENKKAVATVYSISADSTSVKEVHVLKNDSKDGPLIVIDGQKKPASFDVNSIDPDKIDSIQVIKGENAIQKYGPDAADGVIEIYMKKA